MEKETKTKTSRIYLSGPIGEVNSIEQFNAIKEKFQLAEKSLKKYIEPEPLFFNPTENGLSWNMIRSEHMKVDTTALSQCTAIYLFGDWIKSEGCLFELQCARQFGIEILREQGTPNPNDVILTYNGSKLVSVEYAVRILLNYEQKDNLNF